MLHFDQINYILVQNLNFQKVSWIFLTTLATTTPIMNNDDQFHHFFTFQIALYMIYYTIRI